MPRRPTDRKILKDIRERIVEARRAKGWSRERLAEELEVAFQTVAKYETGKVQISIPLLRRLSRVLSVDLTHLLGIRAPDLTKEQAQLLEAFGRLSPEQRAILVAVAREMRRRD